MRCRTKRPIQQAYEETTESGRRAARGTCPVCGAKMFTFLQLVAMTKEPTAEEDLDRLMAERNLDAIVIEGPDGFASANPDFSYMTNGVQLTGAVIKKRGEPADDRYPHHGAPAGR